MRAGVEDQECAGLGAEGAGARPATAQVDPPRLGVDRAAVVVERVVDRADARLRRLLDETVVGEDRVRATAEHGELVVSGVLRVQRPAGQVDEHGPGAPVATDVPVGPGGDPVVVEDALQLLDGGAGQQHGAVGVGRAGTVHSAAAPREQTADGEVTRTGQRAGRHGELLRFRFLSEDECPARQHQVLRAAEAQDIGRAGVVSHGNVANDGYGDGIGGRWQYTGAPM